MAKKVGFFRGRRSSFTARGSGMRASRPVEENGSRRWSSPEEDVMRFVVRPEFYGCRRLFRSRANHYPLTEVVTAMEVLA